jgi:hypothetical protein
VSDRPVATVGIEGVITVVVSRTVEESDVTEDVSGAVRTCPSGTQVRAIGDPPTGVTETLSTQ